MAKAAQCPRCGKPVPIRVPGRQGRPSRWCSDACRKAAHRAGKPRPAAPSVDERRAELLELLASAVLPEGLAAAVSAADEALLAQIEREVRAAASVSRRLLGLLPAPAAPAGTELPVRQAVSVPVSAQRPAPAPEPTKEEADQALAEWLEVTDDWLKSADPFNTAVPAEPEPVFVAPQRSETKTRTPVRRGGLRPTAQQEAIIEACRTGESTVIEAGAGTGKTSTLRLAAEEMAGHGLYLAFNKAIAVDAKKTFPGRVSPRTAHSLAYAETPQVFKARLGGARQPASRAAEILGVTETVMLGTTLRLTPTLIARHALETVSKYCYSDADEISGLHVPRMNGVGRLAREALVDLVVPVAVRAWADLCSENGRLKYGHDHYFKQWALTQPKVAAGFVFLDEAQDTNPVLARVLREQSCQVVVVGDSAQQIYAWRGAVDALRTWPARHRLQLTKSWRFGPVIAEEANLWLTELKASMRLTGNDAINSRRGSLDIKSADAVLCRTNAEAMRQTMKALEAGRRPALVGGTRDIESLARAAQELQDGHATSHPELAMFESWNAVRDHAEQDESASDLRAVVRLIEDHGAAQLLRVAGRVVDETRADLAISTAHKAKGREWEKVLIARDFRAPRRDEDGVLIPVPEEEARLSYVAVTRARRTLDPGGLSWIHTPPSERGIRTPGLGGRAAFVDAELGW